MSELFFLPGRSVINANGFVANGAEVTFYVSGTTTKQPIYLDEDLVTESTNPVESNIAGRIPDIYMDDTKLYRARCVIPDTGEVVFDVDPYQPGDSVNISEAVASYTARAEIAASTAESLVSPNYTDTAAGLADTSDGDSFAVDNGDGTVTIYLNNSGVAMAQRTLATTAALASTDTGEGAALVGVEGGGTVQDIVDIASGSTRLELTSVTIPAITIRVQTTGFAVDGDGGGAWYKRVASQPSHDAKFQDASGAWFELDEREVSVAHYGALNDGSVGQFAAIQSAADDASRLTEVAGGGSTGVAGQTILFEHGEYDFEGNILTLPNYVNVATRGGAVTIINGGFRWETTYGNRVENFRFIDPVVKEATITSITAANPPVVTATAHGFATGDFVRIEDVVGGRVCNTRGYRITVVDVDSFELVDADYVGAPAMTGGKAYCGAAIEFDTNNIARATFEVNNCSCYGTEGVGQAFVSGRQFNQTRSTQLTISNCVAAQIDRVVHSTCDSLVMRGGFYWSSRDGSSTVFVKGKMHCISAVMIPHAQGAGTYWFSYDVAEKQSSNGLIFNGVRLSGEAGSHSAVAVLATSSALPNNNLNSDVISFNDCTMICRNGGAGDNGGVVVLQSNGSGASHCPNAISFNNCDINVSGTSSMFVETESGEPPALTDGYNFQIAVDSNTLKICEQSNVHPVTDELLSYLNTETREHMKARTQTVNGDAIANDGIDILKGSKVKLTSGGTERSLTEVVNFKIGDDLTLIAETGTSVIWRVPHEDGTATTAFHNTGDVDIDPSAPEIHKFVAESATRFVEVG